MFWERPHLFVKTPHLQQVLCLHLHHNRVSSRRFIDVSCNSAVISSGSKTASLGQEKTARRASAVISIFDDSGHEGSENSQDDEQFRARREFLKSGLPESFRKQIARTTATKEAYSLSCSSFQMVTHVKQALEGRLHHRNTCFCFLDFFFISKYFQTQNRLKV